MRTRFHDTKDFRVTEETKAISLARAIAAALASQSNPAVRVHAFDDDAVATYALVKALAMVPLVQGYRRLRCVPNVVRPQEDARRRLFVYVQNGDPVQPPAYTGATFTAYPPGAAPGSDSLRRFCAAVCDRLRRGDVVAMACRGPDAVSHALRALCELQDHAAEFGVPWPRARASSPLRRSCTFCT
ncbi:unnamed protein product [Prorocentrum cordatum]|uniref:Uncharacterized protein n=1 Tax=Prorocentrum cordatum TaxID=2364126 RepID=A0ABN9XL39_9DINO|nr:unnamed protein product [Polarella glacialis]